MFLEWINPILRATKLIWWSLWPIKWIPRLTAASLPLNACDADLWTDERHMMTNLLWLCYNSTTGQQVLRNIVYGYTSEVLPSLFGCIDHPDMTVLPAVLPEESKVMFIQQCFSVFGLYVPIFSQTLLCYVLQMFCCIISILALRKNYVFSDYQWFCDRVCEPGHILALKTKAAFVHIVLII